MRLSYEKELCYREGNKCLIIYSAEERLVHIWLDIPQNIQHLLSLKKS